jgi:hypothetical protein
MIEDRLNSNYYLIKVLNAKTELIALEAKTFFDSFESPTSLELG